MAQGSSPSAPIIIDDSHDVLVLSSRGDDGNESDSNQTVTPEAHGTGSRKNDRDRFMDKQSAQFNHAVQQMLGVPSSVDLSKESKASMMSYAKTAGIALKIANKEPLSPAEQQHWQKRKMEAIEEEVMEQLSVNREQARQVLRSLRRPQGSGSSGSN